MVCTDKYRLQQVLLNYQSNALKFTPRNGLVEIICSKEGDSVHIKVKDTGIGIKKEDIKKLFKLLRTEICFILYKKVNN